MLFVCMNVRVSGNVIRSGFCTWFKLKIHVEGLFLQHPPFKTGRQSNARIVENGKKRVVVGPGIEVYPDQVKIEVLAASDDCQSSSFRL